MKQARHRAVFFFQEYMPQLPAVVLLQQKDYLSGGRGTPPFQNLALTSSAVRPRLVWYPRSKEGWKRERSLGRNCRILPSKPLRSL